MGALKTKTHRKERVRVVTMGCSKNLVDSENIVTQLQGNDIEADHENGSGDPNVIIVNTCGFIESAKQESIDTILHYVQEKERGSIEKLYVTGCLSQRYKEDLREEIPEVDAYFGTMELPALLEKFKADYKHELLGERTTMTPQHYAYLKISEGCNRTCAFCAIPLMRGKHRSRSIEVLTEEARSLAERGVKELLLIAQELTYYGLDIYKRRALPELLHALADVEGIEWIRLHYAYPSKFPLEVIDVMKERKEICNYLDMPLQHCGDEVLNRMRRQITKRETEDLISKIRSGIPDICLRTTLMVGFPGETAEEFDELCEFVRDMRFDRLGVFKYSHEENTRAFEMEDDVPDEIKLQRANRIMDIQRDISLEHNVALIGETKRVLIDRYESGHFVGRTEADSPEVDNEVYVDAESSYARIGYFANVLIEDATEYDLYGRLIHEGMDGQNATKP